MVKSYINKVFRFRFQGFNVSKLIGNNKKNKFQRQNIFRTVSFPKHTFLTIYYFNYICIAKVENV